MTTQITIRNVPQAVRDELATRAAARRQSMQEFLLSELERLTARPSIDAWLSKVESRLATTDEGLSVEQILEYRDADRR